MLELYFNPEMSFLHDYHAYCKYSLRDAFQCIAQPSTTLTWFNQVNLTLVDWHAASYAIPLGIYLDLYRPPTRFSRLLFGRKLHDAMQCAGNVRLNRS